MKKIKFTKDLIIKHLNNFLLLVFSGGFFWLGGSFLEYEISRIQKIGVIFINTPKYLDWMVSSILILGSVVVFAFLALIYYKKLENRRWLWGVVFIQSICLIILAAALGYKHFIWILFPSTFSIFSR